MSSENTIQNTNRSSPVIVWVCLSLFFVVNILQSAFTGLFDDEALFWMYGENLAWGYYEHPSMAGFLIHLGYQILPNALGVRLVFVLLTTISLYLILRMASVRNYLLFFAMAFSILILQAGGFMASPDTCLIFFTVLFFLVYKEYLEQDNLFLAILLGLLIGLMIYCKYNSILIVLFLLVSNLKTLRRPSVYVTGLTAIITLIPHIIWSFQNHHPTIFYHLVERNISEYRFLTYFGEYILGQFGIYGPLMGFILIPVTILYKPGSAFERGLKFSALGILGFFLLYTFRGKVEPNWTVQALIPMLILSYRWVEKRKILRKWVYGLAIISIVLMIGFRIYLVHDFLHLPKRVVNLSELWDCKKWTSDVERIAGDREVVFLSSYQRAAKYTFYTGKPAYNLESALTHRTQYSFWPEMEKELQGKSVMLFDFGDGSCFPEKKSLSWGHEITTYYGPCVNFRSYNYVPIQYLSEEVSFPKDSLVTISFRIINPDPDTLRFTLNPETSVKLWYTILSNDSGLIGDHEGMDISSLEVPGNGVQDIDLKIRTPDKAGDYHIIAGIRSGWLPTGKNMYFRTLKVR